MITDEKMNSMVDLLSVYQGEHFCLFEEEKEIAVKILDFLSEKKTSVFMAKEALRFCSKAIEIMGRLGA